MENNINYNTHIQNDLSLEKIAYLKKSSEYELSEKDFYPPEDTRILHSGVDNIAGGDNFGDYSEYLFDVCDEEEYFDE